MLSDISDHKAYNKQQEQEHQGKRQNREPVQLYQPQYHHTDTIRTLFTGKR